MKDKEHDAEHVIAVVSQSTLEACGADRFSLSCHLANNYLEWTITVRNTERSQVCWIEDDTLPELLQRFEKMAKANKLRWKPDPYGRDRSKGDQ